MRTGTVYLYTHLPSFGDSEIMRETPLKNIVWKSWDLPRLTAVRESPTRMFNAACSFASGGVYTYTYESKLCKLCHIMLLYHITLYATVPRRRRRDNYAMIWLTFCFLFPGLLDRTRVRVILRAADVTPRNTRRLRSPTTLYITIRIHYSTVIILVYTYRSLLSSSHRWTLSPDVVRITRTGWLRNLF